MNNMSLMNIMQNDVEFGRRISKKVAEIKQDKKNLSDIATTYATKYKNEIAEGTELRKKLLTEGSSKGLTESEVMGNYGRFVPAIQTPILNLLYFMLRESDGDTHFGERHYERRDQMNESLIKNGRASIDETYDSPNFSKLSESEAERILDEFIDDQFAPSSSPKRKAINAMVDEEKKTRPEEESIELKEPENMETLLYGELTLSQFDILKKLKALTKSPNVHEATLAFQKGKELCQKYELNWDKIPCSIQNK